MIGSDVSVILDQKNFGLSQESDPRFVSNDIFISKNKTTLSKGVFTVCKKKEGKCPAWSLKAKEISHEDFDPKRPPFTVDHLRKAELSDVFIEYMRNWKGFVVGEH